MTGLPQDRCRVAVLGGGITGLAALHRLQQAREAGAPVDGFLIEARPRPGGLILTEQVQDFIVEAGPDSFLTEKPEALALVKELGLAHELIGSNDSTRRTYILRHGRLVPLPEGLTLFVPARVRATIFSPLVPLASKAAILREVFFRRSARPDESVATFVRRHYGTGMLENIAEPLLAGIFGGDVERLSAQSTLPGIHALEQKYGSLTRGMWTNPKTAGPRPPLFSSLSGGMARLIQALVSRLDVRESPNGTCLKFGERVVEIRNLQPSGPGAPRYAIRLESGAEYVADAIIPALPAPELARLVAQAHPGLARRLGQISYTPAVTVAFGYSHQKTPPGFGFLVPRVEKRRVRACTFVHAKFPGRVPPDAALLRCFMDSSAVQLGDEEIVSAVVEEIQRDLGITTQPDFFRVYRWPAAMPQYEVEHEALLREIREEEGKARGMFLAGNFFSGVGISDCIRSATSAAGRAVQFAKEVAPTVDASLG